MSEVAVTVEIEESGIELTAATSSLISCGIDLGEGFNCPLIEEINGGDSSGDEQFEGVNGNLDGGGA